MKLAMMALVVLMSAGSLSAVTVSDVTIRQDWPWSPRVEVTYTLSGVTDAVNVGVELYSGGMRIKSPQIADTMAGDFVALAVDGEYTLSFDPSGCVANKILLENLTVKVVPGACDPSYSVPLYKVYDLASGECEVITPAKILSGAYGTYRWRDSTPELSASDPVPYVDLIWTGVADDNKYKTTHLVMRYMAAKDDKVYKLGYNGSSDTKVMPEDFYLAVFETTIAQWRKITGDETRTWTFSDAEGLFPANGVSYDEIRGKATIVDEVPQYYFPQDPDPSKFMGKLRTLTGAAFDLPCQHEWNYAWHAKSECVGTSSTVPKTWNDGTPFDDEPPAQYKMKSSGGPVAVGSFNASNQGLFDMHGNVYEWCADWGFTTQGGYRKWPAISSVDPDDPTKVAPGTTDASNSYRSLLGGSFYTTSKDRLMLNVARAHRDSSSKKVETDGDAGFRVRLPSDLTVGEAVAPVDAVAGESAPISVYVNSGQSYLWRTAPGSEFAVSWKFPNGVTSATLMVTGMGYSEVYENLTDNSQMVTLPEGENVYTLTLAFSDGTTKTAKLGSVRGAVSGGEAVVRYVPEVDKHWHYAAAKNVLPIPFGTTAFTIGGEVVDPGLAGAAGWYGLSMDVDDEAMVTLTVGDDDVYENALIRRDPPRLVIFIR